MSYRYEPAPNAFIKKLRTSFFRWIANQLAEAISEEAPLPSPLTTVRTGQLTRLSSLVAIGLSLLSAVTSLWLIFSIKSSRDALRLRSAIPKLDENFDAIAAASAVGRLDIIAIILTFLGIVAALSVLYGWTSFRAAAVTAALQELERQLPAELRRYMDEKGSALVGRALEDVELLARLQERFSSLGIADREEATLVDDDPDFKED